MYFEKNRSLSSVSCILLTLACLSLVASANTLRVPADYATVQAAINAATDGDEIIVTAGTYNEAINFNGKAVHLRSADGPETTIIDAAGLNTAVVTCVSGEGSDMVIEEFTITGGNGGMYNVNSSLTVMGCILWGNAAGYGGGFYSEGGSPTLTNCTIRDNRVGRGGGGLAIEGGSLILTNCTISENVGWTGNRGGARGIGLYIHNASAILTNCTFRENGPFGFYGSGGGVFSSSSSLTLENCTFLRNSSGDEDGIDGLIPAGGGMLNIDSSPTLRNCTFIGNYSEIGSGIANIDGSNPMLINCTFSDTLRGDMAMWNSSPSATNCTFTAGVGGDGGSTPTFTNCILWGGLAANIGNVTYCNVRGGHPGTGNIDADPLFVDPANGDFRLAAGSPCIDAGDPAFTPPTGAQRDLAGRIRIWDGNGDSSRIVDMGAYEFAAPVYGDLNCDGAVNNFDIDPFVLALTNAGAYSAQFPRCDRALADINADQLVNNFDIDPFVNCLVHNGCP